MPGPAEAGDEELLDRILGPDRCDHMELIGVVKLQNGAPSAITDLIRLLQEACDRLEAGPSLDEA